SVSVGASPGPIAAVDVNRDGRLDLVVGDANGLEVLLNDGAHGFTLQGTPIPLPTPSPGSGGGQPVAIVADYPNDPTGPAQLAPLDLNNDGFSDLVVATAGSSNLWILYGREAGGFEPAVARSIAGAANTVTAADFDHDGRVDLAVGRDSLAPLF